jgi:hypothetical protein
MVPVPVVMMTVVPMPTMMAVMPMMTVVMAAVGERLVRNPTAEKQRAGNGQCH